MTDTLAAEVNRTGIHSLEVPDTFETDGAFDVALRNRGEATHVHLHLDDDLSRVARLDATNHYVQADATRRVRVHVGTLPEGTVRGKLKVVTAYGAETRYVTVRLDGTAGGEVAVDPDLSTPQSDERSSSPTLDSFGAPETLPVAALGVVAVVLAVGALFSPPGINVLFGVLAVVAGMLAGAYLLVR